MKLKRMTGKKTVMMISIQHRAKEGVSFVPKEMIAMMMIHRIAEMRKLPALDFCFLNTPIQLVTISILFNSCRSKPKRRKRIRRNSDSSDDDDNDTPKKHGRKNIRKVTRYQDLEDETKEAAQRERERKKRIEERQKMVIDRFCFYFRDRLHCTLNSYSLISVQSNVRNKTRKNRRNGRISIGF